MFQTRHFIIPSQYLCCYFRICIVYTNTCTTLLLLLSLAPCVCLCLCVHARIRCNQTTCIIYKNTSSVTLFTFAVLFWSTVPLVLSILFSSSYGWSVSTSSKWLTAHRHTMMTLGINVTMSRRNWGIEYFVRCSRFFFVFFNLKFDFFLFLSSRTRPRRIKMCVLAWNYAHS